MVIPARFGASRLPGKPLLVIGDRPLIQWVWQRACASGAASVTIATDDARILEAAAAFGADCVMTSAQHASGTDRIAEIARAKGFAEEDIVVNLQGDEPMMPAAVVDAVAQALNSRPQTEIATAVAPILSLAEFLDPSCVKALRARDGHAPVLQPRAGALAARQRRGRSADPLCRSLAPRRHLRLPGGEPAAICRVAADAARGGRTARAAARARARHAYLSRRLVRGAAGGRRYAEDLERMRAQLQQAP